MYIKVGFDNKLNFVRDAFFFIFSFYIFSPFASVGFISFKWAIILCFIWNMLAYIASPKLYLYIIIKYANLFLLISLCFLIYYFFNKRLIFIPIYTYVVMSLYYNYVDKKFIKIHLLLITFYILAIGLYSTYLYISTPNLARILASGDISRTSNYVGFFTANYVSNTLLGFFIIILSGLAIKNKSLFLIIYIIIALYCICKAQYMTVIALVVLGILLNCYFDTKNIKIKLFMLFMVIMLFNLNKLNLLQENIYMFVINIGELIDSDFLKIRLLDLADFLFTGTNEGTVMDRTSLYAISWETIKKYPFWGIGNNGIPYVTIGLHSSVLDLLAYNGIILSAVCLFQLVHALYLSYNTIQTPHFKYNYISLIIIYIILSLFNTAFISSFMYYIIVIVPLLLNTVDTYYIKIGEHIK